MKTGLDTLGTAENDSEAKNMKSDPTRSVPPKTVSGAQNMKTALTPSIPPKMNPGAQNIKRGIDVLGTAENEFGNAKHEIETQRTRHRRKLVEERKT
jgi:hypothetical protein